MTRQASPFSIRKTDSRGSSKKNGMSPWHWKSKSQLTLFLRLTNFKQKFIIYFIYFKAFFQLISKVFIELILPDLRRSSILGNKSENFIDAVIFDGARGKRDFVGHLLKAEFALQRFKIAALLLVLFFDLLGLIRSVLLLLLGGFAHLADLLYLVCQFSLNLKGILRES